MKITIKSIHIENFKGIKMLDVTFSGKTKISGQNAVYMAAFQQEQFWRGKV